MEKTYNPALIQRTQRYMETHSISQNQFAAKVNLSSAALSSYLNQKYKGSVEAVERQLSEFFKLDEEAEAAAEKTASLLPRAAYVPTSISEDVCQSIRFAQLEHCMVVLHGDAGVGKSKGAQKFLHDHPTNAVGISITPSTGTLNGSIKLLARALRVPECRNKMDQMMALRSRLDGTNWVIVIDEAQHLKYAALEEIRSLTDDNPMTVEHGVGVVLIGNSEVYSRLQGRQQAQFAQLFSRIRMQREYTTRKVKEDDVRGLTDIQRAARSIYLIKASFGTDRHTFATAPKGVCNISASFPAVQERLRRVIVENLDFEHLMKTYDRENALFYCDPPYFETEKYYRARFQESDHKRLADALHNIKGRFLLSYNDCPQVRELYADCIIEPVSRRNMLSAQSVDGYKEVLIRNYEL